MNNLRNLGRIKYLDTDSEYGFIARSHGEKDLYFSNRALDPLSYKPKLGDQVSFEISKMRDGKPYAKIVKLVKRPKWELL